MLIVKIMRATFKVVDLQTFNNALYFINNKSFVVPPRFNSHGEMNMKRTASSILRDLEIRVARLEKSAGSVDDVVEDFLARNDIELLSTHFRTHAKEFDAKSLAKAFEMWEDMGGPNGATELRVPGFRGETRLHGKKMGDRIDMRDEEFFYKSRGEGRPPQRLISRPRPMRATDILTLIIVPTGGGRQGLITAYAGPSMPPFEDDPRKEWDKNFLAYSPSELAKM